MKGLSKGRYETFAGEDVSTGLVSYIKTTFQICI